MKIRYVYHGSPRKLVGGKLLAKIPHDIKKKKENIVKGVYASDLRNVAISMAIISCKGVLYASLNTSKPKRKPGIINEGWPTQKYIYLYTLDSKDFKRTSKSSHQWRCSHAIKPVRTERLKVRDYIYLIKDNRRVKNK